MNHTLIVRVIFCSLLVILISACSSSTPVQSLSPDTFTINATSEFGSAYAKNRAIEKANNFAAERNKHMIPVHFQQGSEVDFWGDLIYTYELTFRVVDENDPEYRRTDLDPNPDIVVQMKPDKSTSSDQNADLYTELTKLKALLDDGVINQAEYDKKKTEILERH